MNNQCRQSYKAAKTLCAIGIFVSSLPGIASAATLEEVVVTAQKREQSINDVGISINAFTGQRLKNMGVNSAEGVALHTPGLTVNATSATGVPLYTIRGVGFQDYSTAATSTVGLYFDGVAIPYTVMSRGAVYDVQRVEVLKGPQGDLYGRNTTAGQINFISKKPTPDFEAGISASFGSYKTLDTEGYVSGPLTDSVRGRVAFKTIRAFDGWQESLTRSDDELGKKDVKAIRALLDIDISDSATLLLNAHYVKDKSDNVAPTAYDGRKVGLGEYHKIYTPLEQYKFPGGTHYGETPPWYSTGNNRKADWSNSTVISRNNQSYNLGIRPQRDNDLLGFSANLTWDIGGVTLTSITGYDGFRRKEANDWDGGSFIDASNINSTDLEVFSEEVRLSGNTDTVDWVAGLYYSQDSLDEIYHYFMSDSVFGDGSNAWSQLTTVNSPFVANSIHEISTRYKQKTHSSAVFGHVEWQFVQDWTLVLGTRLVEEKREWRGCTYDAGDGSLVGFLNTVFGSTLQPGACGVVDDLPASPLNFVTLGRNGDDPNKAFHPFQDTIHTQKWMYKVGLNYSITPDVLGYLTYSTGFKSGGFNGANANAQTQLLPYKEEELKSVELGVKATLFNQTMQLNAATFYYDYQDKQETSTAVTLVGNISGLTNVPKSELIGGELEMDWAPIDGLNIDQGVAYLHTKIKKWNPVDPANSKWPDQINTFDASGQELDAAPHWQYNGTVSYEWSVFNGLRLGLAGDFSYKDSTTGPPATPQAAVDDYWVANGRISLRNAADTWRVMLWSKNITDEDYYGAAYSSNGVYVRVNAMPRTVGITFDYHM